MSAPQLARVVAAWPSVLDRLAQGSRVAWTIFAEARPLSVSDGALAVAVPDSGKIVAITQRGHDVRLREALLAVLALDLSIDVVHDAGPAAGTAANPAAGATTAAGRGSTGVSRPGGSGSSRGPARSGGQRARPDDPRPSPVAGSPGSVTETSAPAEASDPRLGNPRAPEASGPPPSRWTRQTAAQAPDDEPDEPADDDPDVDEIDGLALVTRELGARTISEIDHT